MKTPQQLSLLFIKGYALKNIIYLEACGSYTVFYIKNDVFIIKETHSGNLKSINSRLSPEIFYRIHHHYLVNRDFISKIDTRNNVIILMESIALPISRRKAKECFPELFNKRARRKHLKSHLEGVEIV